MESDGGEIGRAIGGEDAFDFEKGLLGGTESRGLTWIDGGGDGTDVGDFGEGEDPFGDGGEARAGLGGDGDGLVGSGGVEIGFVAKDESWFWGDEGDEFSIFGGPAEGVVDEINDGVSVFEGVAGALDADPFDGVVGVAEAGGVDEEAGQTADLASFFEGVAGGASDGGDDGAVGAEKTIQESGFSGVGASDEGDAETFGEDSAGLGLGDEGEDAGLGLTNENVGGASIEVSDFFAEVGAGFHGGEGVEQGLASSDDGGAEGSVAVGVRGAELGLGFGFDGGADGFGLGEVEPAIEEGTLGEFSGASGPGSGSVAGGKKGLDASRGGVDGELDRIFSGIGVSFGEPEREPVVAGDSVPIVGVAGLSGGGEGGENGLGAGKGIWPGEANDSDGGTLEAGDRGDDEI